MSSSTTSPLAYLHQSEVIYTKESVDSAIDTLAIDITKSLGDEMPMVIAVMGGAVVFAGKLLPLLNFPLTFDFVQATRYHNQTQGKQLEWLVEPKNSVKDRTILILDDILDEGHTLKAIQEKCNAMGAKKIYIAVLVEKDLAKSKPIQANFVGLTVPNRYVFGCGMDVYGWWRNLAEIRALI